ncbi:hypothetical protein [Burkholderia sp. LMG 13014]|uniref:hypothetical protein n=1 Tax=Burkholderia sp. LMG 13014 TaxID=2709306 RepID=UPI0019663F28|nr:hypothetical protein [Burkholderia sp. LMG 13014]
MKFYSKEEIMDREQEFQDELAKCTLRFEDEEIDGAGLEGFKWKTFKQGLTLKNMYFRAKQALGLDKPFKV